MLHDATPPNEYAKVRTGRRLAINYQVNEVAPSIGAYGFSVTDSRGRPLVHFEFEHEDKAKQAHRVIGRTVAFATTITPQG